MSDHRKILTPMPFERGDILTLRSKSLLDRQIHLIDWTSGTDPNIASDLLRGKITFDTIVVVRIDRTNQTPAEALRQCHLDTFRKRARPAHVCFLYSSEFDIRVHDFREDVIGLSCKEFLVALRAAELATLLRKSGAIFKLSKGFYFRSPSGALVDHFLRVGNMQQSVSALDRCFFWLLPFLNEVEDLLIDTWSISSIALNAIRRLDTYTKCIRAPQPTLEFLSRYPNDRNVLCYEELQRIAETYRQYGTRHVLLIISVSVTGQVENRLRKFFASQIPDALLDVVSLYQLAKTKEPTLCGFYEEEPLVIRTNARGNVGKRQVYDIDPVTYFPNIMDSRNEKRIEITRDYIRDKEFFNQYAGKECFYVHRDSLDLERYRLRHHAFYIDVSKMLQTDVFRNKLQNHLSVEISKVPSMIVAPNHKSGKALVDQTLGILAEKFGEPPRSYLANRLSDDAPEALNLLTTLSTEAEILILDDVLVTGNRLSQYQEQFRTHNYKGRICYIVGVARCKGPEAFARLVKQFSWNDHLQRRANSVVAVESILLPDWDDEDCPWCREHRCLSHLLYNSSSHAYSESMSTLGQSRISYLRESQSDGLKSHVLWTPTDESELKLGPTSLFISGKGINQGDVAVAMASALQHMRQSEPYLGQIFPRVMLHHGELFMKKWSDPILTFLLWRLATVNEIRSPIFGVESRAIRELEAMLSRLGEDKLGFDNSLLEIVVGELTEKIVIREEQRQALWRKVDTLWTRN